MAATSRDSTRKVKLTLSDLSNLPVQCWLGRTGGIHTLIDFVREENKPCVSALIMATASRGDGLSKDQFQTQRDVDDLLALGVNLCLADRGNSGKLYGFLNVTPSPLCRSNVPIFAAGRMTFSFTDPAGIFHTAFKVLGYRSSKTACS